MTKFYFVRHGEPDWYINERYNFKGHGRDLVPLTDKGIQQAKEAAKILRQTNTQLILTSPYTRTMHTAAILSKELNIEIKVEIDLREWQPDLTYEYDTYDEFMKLSMEYEKCKGEYPEGEKKKWESRRDLKSRVEAVLDRFLEYKEVIVVCHEKVIKTQFNNELIEHCNILELIK